MDPELLHVLEGIVADPNGFEIGEARKVEGRNVRVVADSAFQIDYSHGGIDSLQIGYLIDREKFSQRLRHV